ncbi:hypothetical protein B0H15DRAFT_989360 [Mycena belliarum]|uniref:Uncharacterized protein n=1 Tax=Mycena belliarum TaxID=1033014 RepID=A0AAD6U4N7_9AGAR|nr:hypothetical protein B0H15DRAFT_989360 [Mycena belliae]
MYERDMWIKNGGDGLTRMCGGLGGGRKVSTITTTAALSGGGCCLSVVDATVTDVDACTRESEQIRTQIRKRSKIEVFLRINITIAHDASICGLCPYVVPIRTKGQGEVIEVAGSARMPAATSSMAICFTEGASSHQTKRNQDTGQKRMRSLFWIQDKLRILFCSGVKTKHTKLNNIRGANTIHCYNSVHIGRPSKSSAKLNNDLCATPIMQQRVLHSLGWSMLGQVHRGIAEHQRRKASRIHVHIVLLGTREPEGGMPGKIQEARNRRETIYRRLKRFVSIDCGGQAYQENKELAIVDARGNGTVKTTITNDRSGCKRAGDVRRSARTSRDRSGSVGVGTRDSGPASRVSGRRANLTARYKYPNSSGVTLALVRATAACAAGGSVLAIVAMQAGRSQRCSLTRRSWRRLPLDYEPSSAPKPGDRSCARDFKLPEFGYSRQRKCKCPAQQVANCCGDGDGLPESEFEFRSYTVQIMPELQSRAESHRKGGCGQSDLQVPDTDVEFECIVNGEAIVGGTLEDMVLVVLWLMIPPRVPKQVLGEIIAENEPGS